MTAAPDNYQAQFERRWGHLTRPHVRALAWLLDAPDLLDPHWPQWRGRIATLGHVPAATAGWLLALERDPVALDAALGARVQTRLGLYAEKLMAFYFAQHGTLVAHGLQVRASRNDTVGEFDFLLRDHGLLLHWELATKFYLLDCGEHRVADDGRFNCLIGPNLADTLGAKMRKILDKQLALAGHPAAQPLLPQPVDRAQALVKGWLFYPLDGGDGAATMPLSTPSIAGISALHCHGFWGALAQLRERAGERYIIMPRLHWLAPLKAPLDTPALTHSELLALLRDQFGDAPAPVMVAAVAEQGAWLVERRRGFIVPDDWRAQAATRRLSGQLPS
ncbi:DUF1853 family protein [Rugamonas sp.]|uniref:DUF1853 family protein n=1 Tax=Rugamonas sp. TaxID=1926287 RepID=UPI0025F2692F|nr:DUF1853 family protein [Rugamonas sp.]